MRFPVRFANAMRPLGRIFGMPPDDCFVELDLEHGAFRVKAGIWFDETFSLGRVEDVAPSSWPWWGGLGVKLGPRDSLGVVASTEGVIAIRFKERERMHLIVVVRRQELRVSLEDPDGFMRAMREATARTNGRAASGAQR